MKAVEESLLPNNPAGDFDVKFENGVLVGSRKLGTNIKWSKSASSGAALKLLGWLEMTVANPSQISPNIYERPYAGSPVIRAKT